MAEEKPKSPSDKLPGEFVKRMYDQYDSYTSTFRISYSALVLFALVFYYLVFNPMVKIQVERARIMDDLVGLENKVSRMEANMEYLNAVEKEMQEISESINLLPGLLTKHIEEIINSRDYGRDMRQIVSGEDFQGNSRRNEMMQFFLEDSIADNGPMPMVDIPYRDCLEEGMNKSDYLDCRIRSFILTYIDKILENRIDQIKMECVSLDTHLLSVLDTAALYNTLESLEDSAIAFIDNSPRFYQRRRAKYSFAEEIGKDLEESLSSSETGFNKSIRRLKRNLRMQSALKDSAESLSLALQDKEEFIEKRISGIEFPIGKIPINLKEAVELFPILLTIPFLICIYFYSEKLTIRKSLRDNYYAHEFPDLTENLRDMPLPIWLDPEIPLRKQLAKVLVMLVPFLIFLAALYTMVRSWYIVEEMMPDTVFSGGVIILINLLCLGGFLIGFSTLFRHYKF